MTLLISITNFSLSPEGTGSSLLQDLLFWRFVPQSQKALFLVDLVDIPKIQAELC